ncbi:MAG: helix-turn-helix domain-containing protein [Dehalococcoidia bacterium]
MVTVVTVLTIDGTLSIGKRVRLLRMARDWRQVDLAFACRCTPNAISLIETDTYYPATIMPRISEVLGTDLEAAHE